MLLDDNVVAQRETKTRSSPAGLVVKKGLNIRFMVTPRLALRSPVADCGNTTLLDVLARLTARSEKFDAISTAAIFRLIDATHPTLLIDEADNLRARDTAEWQA